jgi:beta propeller domain-containing protein
LCAPTLAVPKAPKKMKAFTSERELRQYFARIAEKQKRQPAQPNNAVETVSVSSAPGDEESVTNTQHAGVDEGGIVKLHGDHLVILRRGRLFTVAIGDGALKPVSTIDAFGPDIDPHDAWYDEMLVSGDTIAVIGYSYQREGTEIGLFNIDAQGQLSYRSTYHLRSNDYYSSRNYAGRLIGKNLIFYSPFSVYPSGNEDPFQSLPAVRKWHKDATPKEFRRIVDVNRIYRPEAEFDVKYGVTLHTVTICNLANRGFDCQATSVIGPSGHVFYVSPDSVYVWASTWSENSNKYSSILFRLPLDGGGPSALQVTGGPVDQFSFLQSEDRYLNVLVRSRSKGDGMWAAEVAEGDLALMRIPLSSFSDGSQMVPATSYQQLPEPEGYYLQNRFVGDYLIYGTGSSWLSGELAVEQKDLFLVEFVRGTLHRMSLPHGVDRIEQMATGAVVVGTDGKNLHFDSVRLKPQPEIVSRYMRPGASQGELRSHGFFYKPAGDDTGTLGLPISRPGRPGYKHLFESSAAILFLRNEAFQLRVVGELEAQFEKAVDDQCRASCVDWYGNARPLFLRDRVFALLGYELVEGKLDQGRMLELRRISYAPQVSQSSR